MAEPIHVLGLPKKHTKSHISDFAHAFDEDSHTSPQAAWFPLDMASDHTIQVADTWETWRGEMYLGANGCLHVCRRNLFAGIFVPNWSFTPTGVRVKFGINWGIRSGGGTATARVALYAAAAALGFTPEVSITSAPWANSVSEWTDFDLSQLHWAFLRVQKSTLGIVGMQYATLYIEYRTA